MNIKYGIINESFKYQYGLYSTSPKVLGTKDKELFENKSIAITTAKRDWAAFQIMLGADEDFTVSISGKPVFSPAGNFTNIRISASINSLGISMHLVGLVEDDDRIYKADILLNDEVVHVVKDKIQPIWIEITVPENISSGTYAGTVDIYAQHMFEDEKKIDSLHFEIDVKDVLLPHSKDYKFYLDLWQHLSNIARKHEVKLWSDEHFEVIEHYVKSLSELGQKAITIIASEIPWSGQGCFRVKNYLSDLFEYNIIKVEKEEDGSFLYDFSNAEHYINMCFKYGIDSEIEVLGLISIWRFDAEGYGKVVEDYPDGIRVRYLDKKDGCYKYMNSANEIKDYFKAIEKFFIEKNWIDKVRIVADEPHDKKMYGEVLSILKDTSPSFKYKTAINHVDFIEESKDRIDDFVPYLPIMFSCWSDIDAIRKKVKGRLSWYVCCEPMYPNTFICSPLLESRLIGMLTALINFDGFLRWNYTVWPEKPRERMSYNYPIWRAGDTNFVYPANNGKPLLTLRYKNLKRGIEDFELISMLKERHPNSEGVLEKVWAKIFKISDFTEFYAPGRLVNELYSLNYEDYAEVRTLLLNELSNYSGG